MKARHIILGLSALALVACNKDSELSTFASDPNAVHIQATIGTLQQGPWHKPASNPTGITEANRTKFNAGDRISVQTDGQSAVTYVLGVEDVWKPEVEGSYLKWNKASQTFSAYYPADIYDGTQTTVPTDQHEEGHIAQADYMKCERLVWDKSIGAVEFEMQRQTARIVISQIKWAEQYSSDMQNIFSITLCDGVSGDIKPYKAGSGTYYALLMPGSESVDETFIKITVWDGNTVDSKENLIIRGIPELEAGYSYECSLTLGKAVASLGSITVSDWTIGGILGDEENMTEEVL